MTGGSADRACELLPRPSGRRRVIGAADQAPRERTLALAPDGDPARRPRPGSQRGRGARPQGALEERLATGRPLRVKLGLDPTAPRSHLGHTVVLQKLREFQDLGHTVVLIVGDYTARVATRAGARPRGRCSRPRRSTRTRDVRGAGEQGAADRRAARGAPQPRVAGHADGGPVPARRGRATVAQMLERDDFAKRMAADEPISLLELLYPVLQGYDSVAMRADVELGGTDQTFNLLMGRAIQTALRPAAAGRADDAAAAGHRRRAARCRSRSATTSGSPSRRARCTARRCASRTRRWTSWYELLLGGDAAGGRRRRATPSARSRARSWSASTAPRPRRRPRPASTACSSSRELPEEIEEAVDLGQRRRRAPARGDRRPVRRLALGGAARSIAQGGVKLDGEPVPATARRAGERARRARAAGRQAPLPPAARRVTVHTGLLRLETEGEGQIVDLTEGVLAVVRQSEVAHGPGERVRDRLDGRRDDDGVRAGRRAGPAGAARAARPARAATTRTTS